MSDLLRTDQLRLHRHHKHLLAVFYRLMSGSIKLENCRQALEWESGTTLRALKFLYSTVKSEMLPCNGAVFQAIEQFWYSDSSKAFWMFYFLTVWLYNTFKMCATEYTLQVLLKSSVIAAIVAWTIAAVVAWTIAAVVAWTIAAIEVWTTYAVLAWT